MKITIRPTITLNCPKNLEKYVDEIKLQKYLSYDKKAKSFESQLVELAASRVITQCLAMSIADSLNELDAECNNHNWLSVAKEIGSRLVDIRWDAKT